MGWTYERVYTCRSNCVWVKENRYYDDNKKAYEKFYKLLEQIDNSDIPSSEQYELYQNMESEIEQKKQQAYANMNEY